MQKNKAFTWMLVIALLLPFKLSAAALDMVVTEHFPPYQIQSQQNVSGVAYDIVENVLKCSDINIAHSVLPWSRAYHIASQQKNVLIYSMRRTKKREQQFEWIGPIFSNESILKSASPLILWQLNSSFKNAITVSTMKNLTLVVARGDYIMDEIVTRYQWPTDNVIQVKSWTAAIKLLQEKRVDAMVLQENNLIALSKRLGVTLSDFMPVLEIDHAPQLYMALSKGSSSELQQKLKACLSELHASKTYTQIERNWQASFY